jgi:hypothetical protein
MEERSRDDDDETHELLLLLLLFLFPLLNVFTLPLRIIEDATSHARTNLVLTLIQLYTVVVVVVLICCS